MTATTPNTYSAETPESGTLLRAADWRLVAIAALSTPNVEGGANARTEYADLVECRRAELADLLSQPHRQLALRYGPVVYAPSQSL